MTLDPQDRAYLRSLLIKHYNLSELKDLAFDLDVDFQLFEHNTIANFVRDIITYFERRQNLSCLIEEITKSRQATRLANLLIKLPPCKFGKIWYDESSDKIYQGKKPLLLPPTAIGKRILQLFLKRPYEYLTFNDILDATLPEEPKGRATTLWLMQVVELVTMIIEPDPFNRRYIIEWHGQPEGGYIFYPEGKSITQDNP
jgi:hypothetical protein